MRLLITLLLFPGLLAAQTFGPYSPTTGSNVATVGTNAWSHPTRITSSNNQDAVSNDLGTTNYLQGTDFGFNLQSTDVISGIRLDVERSSTGVSDVALHGNWTVGTSRSLPNGENRCLVVVISVENETARDITSVTFGGQSLTQLTEAILFTPFHARTEVWYLLESELEQATNTTISYAFGSSTPSEDFEIVSSAIFINVDQLSPFNDFESSTTTSTAAAYQLGSPVNTLDGSMTVASIFCGNPPSPSQALGNANAFSVNGSFSEKIDYHGANNNFSSSGGVVQIAQKASDAVGTEQPTFTFSGTPNRRVAVAFSLRRARQLDYIVRLRKASGIIGGDKAQSAVEWPEADTYASYGGASDLWGTTWTYADINDDNFGAALSVNVQNGAAHVDHMRISVFTSSVLPLELVDFGAVQVSEGIQCSWITASERNTDVFIVEHSTDGYNFEAIGTVQAAGNSESALSYSFLDETPAEGTNYYRLRTVDTDANSDMSDIVSESFVRQQEEKTMVYPNPTSDWATVLTPNGFDEIVITSDQGRIVDRITGNSMETSQKLNLYDMPDGVYFVCIKQANGKTEIQRLAKTSKTL